MKKSASSIAVVGFTSVLCTTLLLTVTHMSIADSHFKIASMRIKRKFRYVKITSVYDFETLLENKLGLCSKIYVVFKAINCR